jgi:hypothetical protein
VWRYCPRVKDAYIEGVAYARASSGNQDVCIEATATRTQCDVAIARAQCGATAVRCLVTALSPLPVPSGTTASPSHADTLIGSSVIYIPKCVDKLHKTIPCEWAAVVGEPMVPQLGTVP